VTKNAAYGKQVVELEARKVDADFLHDVDGSVEDKGRVDHVPDGRGRREKGGAVEQVGDADRDDDNEVAHDRRRARLGEKSRQEEAQANERVAPQQEHDYEQRRAGLCEEAHGKRE